MSDSSQHGFDNLDQIRARIDELDQQIQLLVEERMRASLAVADIKQRDNPGGAVNFYRAEREAQILREIARRNQGPLDDASIQRIFREIISSSLALEEPMKVAYLGPEGTYSQAATFKHFGHAVKAMPEAGIADIFHAVETGRVRFGVVPVENSTEGAINQTLDLLSAMTLKICGEVRLRIQHCLLSRADNLEAITSVHAHPQALAQCRHWLDANLPHAERISESSNATAAEHAANEPVAAALAGEHAAELYKLSVLVSGVEDEKRNTTRFLVIGNYEVPPSGEDVTSLLVSAPHQPGGLRKMLQPMESAGVSMSRIESRPSRGQLWEYVFFIDIAGHHDDETLKPMLAELAELAPLVRVLGSYPKALS